MGVGRFLLSLVSARVLGEETVKKQEEMYHEHATLYPDLEPHQHLALVWLSRMRVNGRDISGESMREAALTETRLFACVPPPWCAEALGLYILYKEAPDIVEKHKVFEDRYDALMRPVYEAEQDGRLDELYGRYNPDMARMAEEAWDD